MKKFQADPQGVLAAPPKPMGGGFVSLGMVGAPRASFPEPRMERPAPSTVSTQHAGVSAANRDTRKYVCPMCPEVSSIGPAPCPKCGMALEPESANLAPTKTEYTCPMHPEVVRSEPGSCPICGMALEPRSVTLEEDNPELRDMTRRFWIGVALTAPLLAIAMGNMIWPALFPEGTTVYRPERTTMPPWSSMVPWLELLLATPVVLWCGWPFFQRGWASIVNRSTNMFTLIAMGTGVAYVYSVVATLFPANISGVVPQHGRPP